MKSQVIPSNLTASEARVANLVWLAFSVFQVLLALLAFVITSKLETIASVMQGDAVASAFATLIDGSNPAALAPLAMGFASLAASFYVPQVLARQKAGSEDHRLPNSAPIGVVHALPLPLLIVRYAMVEFCGLTGFVAVVLTNQPVVGLPSIAAAFVALLTSKPQ